MSLSPLLTPSVLIEQLRLLEGQIPPPGLMTSLANTTEQVATANQILTNVRQLCEKLVIESTEASQSLSQALLDIVVYAEWVDNVGHLLSLADSCIGQIRSWMRAHGIPIHIPSTPSNAVIVPNVGPAVQGLRLSPVPMDHPPPAGTPPPGFMEYLAAFLAQNGSLPSIPTSQPLPQPSTSVDVAPDTPTPPVQSCSFTRLGRGTEGELSDKLKVSKQITASATKRKSQLDPEAEIQLSPMSGAAKGSSEKKVKHARTTKANGRAKQSLPKAPRKPVYSTPAPTDPDPIPSPISTPAPPTLVHPVGWPKKSSTKVKAPPPQQIEEPLVDDDDVFTVDVRGNNDGSNNGIEGSDFETEVPGPANNGHLSTPTQNSNTTLAGPSFNLAHAYLSHFTRASLPAVQAQPPSATQPQVDGLPKAKKGVRTYPAGWQKLLNASKDLIRGSILLKNPFPDPPLARVWISECFQEIYTTKCNEGIVLEPRHSFAGHMIHILLTNTLTSQGELKKLARLLVATDPGLFPLSTDQHTLLNLDLSAPEIRTAAARLEKRQAKSRSEQPRHDPAHVQTSIAERLAQFAFLNDPPTSSGDPLVNPILEKLCKSFYEEVKWQRALMYHTNGDNEWISSVTLTMVSFAATAYSAALEEQKTGNFVNKKFEVEKFKDPYTEIYNHILDHLKNDPLGEATTDRFASWVSESAFVELDSEDEDEDE